MVGRATLRMSTIQTLSETTSAATKSSNNWTADSASEHRRPHMQNHSSPCYIFFRCENLKNTTGSVGILLHTVATIDVMFANGVPSM